MQYWDIGISKKKKKKKKIYLEKKRLKECMLIKKSFGKYYVDITRHEKQNNLKELRNHIGKLFLRPPQS